MQIYLLRHGIAEDARPGHSDSERAMLQYGIAYGNGYYHQPDRNDEPEQCSCIRR